MDKKFIGKSIFRKEGILKVTGKAKYIDDIVFEDHLYGTVIRSQVPRGIVKKIVYDPKINWKEFVVVTAKDIPGKNYVALILDDQPFLVDKKIHHQEEPILLLAHKDKYQLEKAKSAIHIEVEELSPILTIEDSLSKKQIIWGRDNIFKSYLVEKGNVDAVWKKAFRIYEHEYSTGAQEQLYIEPNGMVAKANPKDGVTIWGSMQCPYYVHKALLPLFGIEENKVRIIQTETGGGFGGKEEYPSLLAGYAALLAWKSGQTVKMIYDRAEDMVASTKRHPSITKHKTAVDKNGKILAMEIDFLIDGGAYCTLSPVVLSRGTLHAAGPYYCENIRIRSKAVATNTPPHGAFRGFGAPQSIFALERQIDIIANDLKIDPTEMRRINFVKTGQTTATNQIVRDKIDMNQILKKAMALTKYKKKKTDFNNWNKKSKNLKKGIGVATFYHGAGFTGSGEKYLASVVGAELTIEGKVRILSASTEIGQGTNTVFSQIAAEKLGIDFDLVEVAQPDTRTVPNSGPTVASRTCMVVGKLVEQAVEKLKITLQESGYLPKKYTSKVFRKAALSYLKKFGSLKVFSQYKQPPNVNWDEERYQGDAYATYAWASYIAEVSVNLVTYETKVERLTAVQEIGKVVNPILAEGQIEGGVAQGVGFALYEKVVWKNGRMENGQMTNYIMPTSVDAPEIVVHFLESNSVHGPRGAKGIGELPMDGPAPAIINAISNALSDKPVLNKVPFLPEDLMETINL